MRIVRHVSGAKSLGALRVVAVGCFDGLHLTHQRVLGATSVLAKEQDARVGVLLLPPGAAGYATTPVETPRQRWRRLSLAGCDWVLCAPRRIGPPLAWLRNLFVEGSCGTQPVVVVEPEVGKELLDVLRSLRESGRIGLEVVEPARIDAIEVTSRRLVDSIGLGDLSSVRRMLGRDLEVEGRVRHGFRRGHTIGFPTANLRVAGVTLPPNGVYVVQVQVADRWYGGVANLGVNPTFGGRHRTLESYLFDFDADLYGRRIVVRLLRHLREERKFKSVEELTRRIRADAEAARALLRGSSLP